MCVCARVTKQIPISRAEVLHPLKPMEVESLFCKLKFRMEYEMGPRYFRNQSLEKVSILKNKIVLNTSYLRSFWLFKIFNLSNIQDNVNQTNGFLQYYRNIGLDRANALRFSMML